MDEPFLRDYTGSAILHAQHTTGERDPTTGDVGTIAIAVTKNRFEFVTESRVRGEGCHDRCISLGENDLRW